MQIKFNGKYQTRDGRPVQILGVNGRVPYVVYGYVGDTCSFIYSWTIGGKHVLGAAGEYALDLVEVPENNLTGIQVGQSYRMRNGEIARISRVLRGGLFPVRGYIGQCGEEDAWTSTGAYTSTSAESLLDLVELVSQRAAKTQSNDAVDARLRALAERLEYAEERVGFPARGTLRVVAGYIRDILDSSAA